MEILKPRLPGWPVAADFSAIEDRVKAGSWVIFDDVGWYQHFSPVKEHLTRIQEMQSRPYGEDPLFEAMERSNKLPKMGFGTLKVLCTAQPMKLHDSDVPTNGPIKAKDWQ